MELRLVLTIAFLSCLCLKTRPSGQQSECAHGPSENFRPEVGLLGYSLRHLQLTYVSWYGKQSLINSVYLLFHGHEESDVQTLVMRGSLIFQDSSCWCVLCAESNFHACMAFALPNIPVQACARALFFESISSKVGRLSPLLPFVHILWCLAQWFAGWKRWTGSVDMI